MNLKTPIFTIVVVAHNSGQYLSQCITALNKQTFEDFELLIVDNASGDGSIKNLNLNQANLKVIETGENIGFAAANNVGAKQARGNWLVTLNADAFPEADWLLEIFTAIKRYPKIVMFGSTQLKFDNPEILDGAGDHYHPAGLAWRGGEGQLADVVTSDTCVIAPCAAAAAYRRDIYIKLGGMAEEFFCYYEDVDLALRFRLMGYPCIQLCKAKVRHVGSVVAGKNSEFIRYHVSRNRIWTFIRCVPNVLLPGLLPLLIASILTRILASIFVGDVLVRLNALKDAILGIPTVWRERENIQKSRKITVFQFGSAMTWSIGKLLLRARDARPVPAEINKSFNIHASEAEDG